jgi:CheY-like chemotaxis protein
MNSIYPQDERADDCRAAARSPGILIVDDTAFILTLLKFEMESRGFNVWIAVDGDDAVDLYRRHREQIDVVVLDVQMPGLDGPQTLEAIQRLNPDVVACFMSGNVGPYTPEQLHARGAVMIFAKPFHTAVVADLLQKVAGADSTPFVCDWQVPRSRVQASLGPESRWERGPL